MAKLCFSLLFVDCGLGRGCCWLPLVLLVVLFEMAVILERSSSLLGLQLISVFIPMLVNRFVFHDSREQSIQRFVVLLSSLLLSPFIDSSFFFSFGPSI